jgi:hypothetical protein
MANERWTISLDADGPHLCIVFVKKRISHSISSQMSPNSKVSEEEAIAILKHYDENSDG